MTTEDREWLEQHLRGPVLARFDRVEEQVTAIRERLARVEERSILAGAVSALVVTPIVAAIIVEVLK